MLDDYTDKVEVYLSNLWEIDRNTMDSLKEEDYEALTHRLLRQTPTKMLPKFEDYDKTRDVMCMMSAWMEEENEELGLEILNTMKRLIITAMTPQIEDRMSDYARREAIAIRETHENERLEGIAYDRQRI